MIDSRIFAEKHKALAVTLFALAINAASCSNSGKGEGTAPKTFVDTSEARGANAGKPSRIVITLDERWSALTGYVVGEAQHASLQKIADQNGKPGFLNMSAGTYDIILEGQEKGADGKLSPVALRVSGVKITEGLDTQIRDIELKPYLKLQGSIKLASEPAQAGINVSIAGTSLATKTLADGSFVLEAPAGNHALAINHSGYAPGFLSTKPYRADEHLPTLMLVPESSRLDTGAHYLGENVVANSPQKISVQMVAPANMTHFRFGTIEDVAKKPWIVLQSSLEIDLPTGDHPEVAIQYSLDQRQLSPIYTVNIPVKD